METYYLLRNRLIHGYFDIDLVIALGSATFNVLRKTCDNNYSWSSGKYLIKSNNQHFKYTYKSKNPGKIFHSEIWFQFHTSQQAQNPRGPAKIDEDWTKMKKWFEENCL